jgi:hypothetical protein
MPISQAFAYTPDIGDYSLFFWESYNAWPSHEAEADALNYLGLFKGTGSGYELERPLNRIEALVTVIRLVGGEEEALRLNAACSFSDVPPWATAYAGYGEANSLAFGIGGGRFGAADRVTAQQYVTMLLRVLGYNDQAGDFAYDTALVTGKETGLLNERALRHFSAEGTITRGDAAYLMYVALRTPKKGAKAPLVFLLTADGVLEKNTVYGALVSNNEPEQEIIRALKNGFSEFWLNEIYAIIDKNANISQLYKPIFKESAYNFLKEAGAPMIISQLKFVLARITVNIRTPYGDEVFKSNPDVLAYYQYPNSIVARHDMDGGLEHSAFTHEIRHAVSGIMGNITVEEGMTDLWNQEVNSGLPAYDHHHLNIAKLFTHITGAERMNEISMTSNIEALFYELELVTGVSIKQDDFSQALFLLSKDTSAENVQAVRTAILGLLKGYYEKARAQLALENSQRYVDTLIALGQLLYYPSAMVQDVDTNNISEPPSSFYTAEYEDFVQNALKSRATASADSLAALQDYYAKNKNSRICLKYFGPDAGRVMVKNGIAYKVEFSYDGKFSHQIFGSRAAAEAFKARVKVVKVSELPGAAFAAKVYN